MTQKSNKTKITTIMWDHITPIFDKILAHPFIKGLTTGDLDRTSFQFYTVQDALYLKDYARALSMAAVKAPDEEKIILFNEHSMGCLIEERAMQEHFFKGFGMAPEDVWSTPMAPTCQAYTSYLLSVAYARPFHEVLAVVLPCYWIYWEVGKALTEKGSPDDMYQKWIDTYASDEFAVSVETVLEIIDHAALSLTDTDRSHMLHHFITTSRYEWMFWEMGYKKEQWPV
jgi:thiaminase (transcriptional activator TenA)